MTEQLAARARSLYRLRLAAPLCFLFLFDFQFVAQTRDRIPSTIDDENIVRLKRNHPLAIEKFDAGPADPSPPMKRMILVLQPDAAQQAAATELIEPRHDPSSPEHHKWLTPPEYASQFGVSESDVQRVRLAE